MSIQDFTFLQGLEICQDEFPSESVGQYVERHFKRVGMQAALAIPGLDPWFYRKMRNVGKAALGDSEKVIRNGLAWE